MVSIPDCAHITCTRRGFMFAGVPLCRDHYKLLRSEMSGSQAVDILALLPKPSLISVRPGTLERFASLIDFGHDDCLLRWKSPSISDGYGKFTLNGARVGAHVASHLMFVGPVPDGWHVDHVRKRGCTHRDCVWWEHLEAVTPEENWRRGEGFFGAWQRAKTHCKRGHEFTPENIKWVGSGLSNRQCKTCNEIRRLEEYWQGREPLRGTNKTHCGYGHEFTPGNTYTDASGARRCRECALENSKRRRRRLQAEKWGQPVEPSDRPYSRLPGPEAGDAA